MSKPIDCIIVKMYSCCTVPLGLEYLLLEVQLDQEVLTCQYYPKQRFNSDYTINLTK